MSFVVTTQGGATFFISPSACLFNCKWNDVTFHPGTSRTAIAESCQLCEIGCGQCVEPRGWTEVNSCNSLLIVASQGACSLGRCLTTRRSINLQPRQCCSVTTGAVGRIY